MSGVALNLQMVFNTMVIFILLLTIHEHGCLYFPMSLALFHRSKIFNIVVFQFLGCVQSRNVVSLMVLVMGL